MSASTQVRIPPVETEFVDIPETQLKVSRVALGTWAMGGWMWGGTDQRESVATIHAALHQGINLIDTDQAHRQRGGLQSGRSGVHGTSATRLIARNIRSIL
jgi:predicted aldo/keto reductase-like oxidoreductase